MKDDYIFLIDSVQRYLRQQQEQYGPTVYYESSSQKNVGVLREKSSTQKFNQTEDLELFSPEPAMQSTEQWQDASTLHGLNDLICHCQKCPLGQTRKNFVFGVGKPQAQAVLIGEAPGAEEDQQGEPFVGRAGQLLNKILEAIHFKRNDVFICNILKCRPPNNRDPLPSEVEKCEPYLHKQLEILQPKIMLALGRIAAQTLLRTNDSLTVMRSKTHIYHGIPLVVTYHPAAILRNPNWKKPTWEDVQKFRKLYDDLVMKD